MIYVVTPICPQTDVPLRYRIVEELKLGTNVADLMIDAGFKRRYTPDVLAQLEFRLLTEPPPVPLTVGSKTGVLSTSGRVDREQVRACRGRDLCQLTLDVTVRPPRYFQVIKVVIDIGDINDNTPTFSPDFLALEISESVQPGTEFALPPAEDADGPNFRVAHYDLRQVLPPPAVSSTGEPFSLSVRGRPGGNFQLRLVVRSLLDREAVDVYRFVIQ